MNAVGYLNSKMSPKSWEDIMKLKSHTYKKFGKAICGDEGPTLRLSGPDLIDFFNEMGFNEVYGQGFPTRYIYAQEKAQDMIENGKFELLVNSLLDGVRYVDSQYKSNEVMDYLNSFIQYEGYQIKEISKNKYKICSIEDNTVLITKDYLEILSTEFLADQIDKCNRKVAEGDYYGAITNARSMVEEVLLAIEEKIIGSRGPNNGDMGTLYKRVSKVINFDAGKDGLQTPLKQILSGLNNIVIGLGALRTKASDSHAPEYKPEKHHAVIAVNSAMTFTSFIISSYQYQIDNKNIHLVLR